MAELSFRFLNSEREEIAPDRIISYELSREISAPCDSLRVKFISKNNAGELVKAEAHSENGLVFRGFCDVQKEEVKSGYTEYFIFARSLASLLVDNEAEPETYYSPTAKALFIINAEKFGFSFDFQDCAASGKYVVSKGSSCYSAINRLVSAQYGKSITVTPDGHITVPEGKSVLTLEGDRIISEKRIINRGAPVSQVDYKIASNSSYSHHMKSRSLEKRSINRIKKVNLSSLFDWQRESEVKRIITDSARSLDCIDYTLSGAFIPELYGRVSYENSPYDLSGYYISAICASLDKNGEQTYLRLSKEFDAKEIIYVD